MRVMMVSFCEVMGSWHLREPCALQFIMCLLFLDTPNRCLLENRVENKFILILVFFNLAILVKQIMTKTVCNVILTVE